MRTVTEERGLRQSKEIFNNTPEKIDEKILEETDELKEAIKSKDRDAIIDEAGDVLYVLSQKFELLGTDIIEVLKGAIVKNEKKRE